MTTIPWTEKYRPKTLKEVIDQKAIVQSLKSVVKSRAIPHMLFVGPAGVGKTASAHALARDLYGEGYMSEGMFVEVNASDERGLQTVREKVKLFARSRAFGEVGFRIILLDESDQLTEDAQHALRRIMEQFSSNCRFILVANYSNRIIEPIQSRCATFRFRLLPEKIVTKYLGEIGEKESLKATQPALETIYELSNGDLRKCINALQAASSLSKSIDESVVYKVMGYVDRGEVQRMLELAASGGFLEAREMLRRMLYYDGIAGRDILDVIFRQIFRMKIPDRRKMLLVDQLGEVDHRISEGASEEIQLSAFLAKIRLTEGGG